MLCHVLWFLNSKHLHVSLFNFLQIGFALKVNIEISLNKREKIIKTGRRYGFGSGNEMHLVLR